MKKFHEQFLSYEKIFFVSCFQAKLFSEQKIREENIFGFVKGKVKPKGEGEAKQN